MQRPEIVLIAAIAEKNRVIGKNGELPWTISEDLKRFKRMTVGHTVIMGRKTFESIITRLGKPLPERRNIVLTSTRTYPGYPQVQTYPSLESALESVIGESAVFIIGGEAVFSETLPMADRLELTLVEKEVEGDAFFPEYANLLGTEFLLERTEQREGYRFETYRRGPSLS
ncbi:MAG: dihydrofolate reductase [bacterium]